MDFVDETAVLIEQVRMYLFEESHKANHTTQHKALVVNVCMRAANACAKLALLYCSTLLQPPHVKSHWRNSVYVSSRTK